MHTYLHTHTHQGRGKGFDCLFVLHAFKTKLSPSSIMYSSIPPPHIYLSLSYSSIPPPHVYTVISILLYVFIYTSTTCHYSCIFIYSSTYLFIFMRIRLFLLHMSMQLSPSFYVYSAIPPLHVSTIIYSSIPPHIYLFTSIIRHIAERYMQMNNYIYIYM